MTTKSLFIFLDPMPQPIRDDLYVSLVQNNVMAHVESMLDDNENIEGPNEGKLSAKNIL